MLKECLALSRESGTDRDGAYVLNGPSALQILRGNQARAVELLEEYLSL